MRYVYYSVLSVLFVFLVPATAEDAVSAEDDNRPNVLCADGFSTDGCQIATSRVHVALRQLSVSIPGWRWIVVTADNWQAVATSFGLSPNSPAFSSLAIHSTYIKASLVVPDLRGDENLQIYSSRSGIGRLRWVLAHESGHIVCNTADESKAEAAAGRIEFGNKKICR